MLTSVYAQGIVLKKLSMNKLLTLEKKYSLWEHKLFDYPLWIHCREPLLDTGVMVERVVKRPTLFKMIKSFIGTIKFLLTQKKYDNVYFLMERAELLEIYKNDKNSNKILFLNPEQEKVMDSRYYVSSDFFNLLRFISRKVTFLIYWKQYQLLIRKIKYMGLTSELHYYIKAGMGDAFFLFFLSLVLSKKNKKIYTGSVIPMGEKFLNKLNSFEVQHGVIHLAHLGYIKIPKVENTLILYHKRYVKLLIDSGYEGKLIVQEYKKSFFEKETLRHFSIVIYTQPILKMQQAIRDIMKKRKDKNIYIQKHPKDYFNYELDQQYFITGTTPMEVDYPIMYVSSIIENFTLYNKHCYIYDINHGGINIEDFLKIYVQGSKSEITIEYDLDKIFLLIENEQNSENNKGKII